MNTVYIMDTSFLLELNQIPGKYSKSRADKVKKTIEIVDPPNARIHITVPILFEYAGHLANLDDDTIKRRHIIQLNEDIRSSLNKQSPWQVYGRKEGILLKTGDILELSQRYATTEEMYTYSFADLSIIQAKEQLIVQAKKELEKQYEVEILTFEKKLSSYSTSRECPLP